MTLDSRRNRWNSFGHAAQSGVVGCVFAFVCLSVGCQQSQPTINAGSAYVELDDEALWRALDAEQSTTTPQDNWEVAVREVCGPFDTRFYPLAQQDAYYNTLGINRSDPSGEDFESFEISGEAKVQLKAVIQAYAPCNPGEIPELAEWLDEKSARLDALATAALRPKYYQPYMPQLTRSRSTARTECHVIARIWVARALVGMSHEETTPCQKDIAALHCLARLCSQRTRMDWMLARGYDAMACELDMTLLNSGLLDEESCEKHLKALEDLPPVTPLTDVIDTTTRTYILNTVYNLEYQPIATLRHYKAVAEEEEDELAQAIEEHVDWDVVRTVANTYLDRQIEGMKFPPHEWQVNCDALKADEDALADGLKFTGDQGKLRIHLGFFAAALHVEAKTDFIIGPQIETRRDIIRTAYRMHLQRLQTGRLPTSADELKTTVLTDGYTGKPLKIKATKGGALIYSVGWNQVDDSEVAQSGDASRVDDIMVIVKE